MAGKWETARLILAIAAAQYKAPNAKATKYSTKDIKLGEVCTLAVVGALTLP